MSYYNHSDVRCINKTFIERNYTKVLKEKNYQIETLRSKVSDLYVIIGQQQDEINQLKRSINMEFINDDV